MKSLIWKSKEEKTVELIEKPYPQILNPKDAIVKVTLSSICTSDLHIKHGFIPQAKEGVILGHEFVGIVTEVGAEVKTVALGKIRRDLRRLRLENAYGENRSNSLRG